MRNNSIHRMLAIRLAMVAFGVALSLAFIVFCIELRILDDQVQDQATSAVERLRWSIIHELDAEGLGNHAHIQQTLEKGLAAQKRPGQSSFVYIRILDPAHRVIAQIHDSSNAEIQPVINQLLTNNNSPYRRETALRNRITRVNGTLLIQLEKSLENSHGKPVAYVEGAYTISPSYIRKARYNAAMIALLAAGIVLLTTFMLYPTIMQLLKKVAGLSIGLVHANLEILSVLGGAIAKRDTETGIHNCRVTIYVIRIAQEMGLKDDEIRSLIKGAFLHDIGKIGVKDSILLKPDHLTPEEFEETKQHVRHGLDIVNRSGWLADAALIIGSHHEKYDGSGYPNGLKGEEIPMDARIFAIADVFDALTSKRPYKKTMSCAEASDILQRGRGSHFDPDILDVFVKIVPELYTNYAEMDDENLKISMRQLGVPYFLYDGKVPFTFNESILSK